MSLNRSEQRILDYVNTHPDERHFWEHKVRSLATRIGDVHETARLMDSDLWEYYKERSQFEEPFRSAARIEGLQRTSMRSLADYWVRLWAPTLPKKEFKGTYDGYGA